MKSAKSNQVCGVPESRRSRTTKAPSEQLDRQTRQTNVLWFLNFYAFYAFYACYAWWFISRSSMRGGLFPVVAGSCGLTYVPGHGIPFARALDYGK